MTAEPVSALSAPTLPADAPADRGPGRDAGRSAALTELPAEPGPGHGARLLVVDDDPDVRLSLERALSMAGYAGTTALQGADAVDCLARTPVDRIVLDVMMRMVDGFEACRPRRRVLDATPIL